VQSGTQIVAEVQSLFDDARAALHVFDGLTRLTLNALNEVGNFLGGLRRLSASLRTSADESSMFLRASIASQECTSARSIPMIRCPRDR